MSGHSQSNELARDIRAALMPGFEGFAAPAWVLDALGDGLLSVCVYGSNVRDGVQLAALGAQLQAAAPHSLRAIDEEGGEVTRLDYRQGSRYPGSAVLGRIDDPVYTAEVGRRVGIDILAAGFNLALAPDADVNSNPENPVIGTRSFSADPAVAARHTAAWVTGLQSAGAVACPKHFPGHGDTAQDSHLALPVVDAPLEVLVARDLPPFQAAIDAGAKTMMTSHILLPQVDPAAPATLSRAVLQGLLRERLGFTGVIVSDALDMAGASGEIGIPEAAVRALAAGCDLLCLGVGATGESVAELEAYVAEAVRDGRLGRERVREAADRARRLSGTLDSPHPTPMPAPGDAEIPRIAASFAGVADARAWVRAHPSAWVLRFDTDTNMAVGDAPWGPFAAAASPLPGREAAANAFSVRPQIIVDAEQAPIWPIPELRQHGIIAIGRNIHRYAFARERITELRTAGVPVLCVETAWPGTGYADLASFSPTRLAGAAVVDLIEGGAA